MKYRRPIITATALVGLTLFAIPFFAGASSHREAPLITNLPKEDNTDVYAFMSYEPNRSGFVTLIANFQPFQEPFGGPNYYMMDPNAAYDINIDNNGDAKPELTFRFQFQHVDQNLTVPAGNVNQPVPLLNLGPLGSAVNPPSPNLNVVETYQVTLLRPGAANSSITNAGNSATTFVKPADNIGQKSIPNYVAYAQSGIYAVNIPGCSTAGRLFVGQRREPFVINVGETFDLVNYTNPIGEQFANTQPDSLGNLNITSLELEVAASCLTNPNSGDPVIGVWATASLPQVRVLRPQASFKTGRASDFQAGALTQVSRLGNPLVNELVIGLKDKDKFNASQPINDAQFLTYVDNPSLPQILQIIFGSAGVQAPSLFPRVDLEAVFLTGLANLNRPSGTVTPAEEQRLNTSIAPANQGQQNRLGVIGGDKAGFPNGRRPGDDVVDIELRVLMGRLITLGLFGAPNQAPSGTADFTDGAFVDSTMFANAFPYLNAPLAGSPNGANGVPAGTGPSSVPPSASPGAPSTPTMTPSGAATSAATPTAKATQ